MSTINQDRDTHYSFDCCGMYWMPWINVAKCLIFWNRSRYGDTPYSFEKGHVSLQWNAPWAAFTPSILDLIGFGHSNHTFLSPSLIAYFIPSFSFRLQLSCHSNFISIGKTRRDRSCLHAPPFGNAGQSPNRFDPPTACCAWRTPAALRKDVGQRIPQVHFMSSQPNSHWKQHTRPRRSSLGAWGTSPRNAQLQETNRWWPRWRRRTRRRRR